MTVCAHCGERVKPLNPHHMDRQKFRMLAFLAEANDWVKIDTGSSPRFAEDERIHAMRLTWFGLAEHGPRRSALYRITPDGFLFLQGKHMVPAVIWCKDGGVVARSSVLVGAESIRDVVLDKDYWDSYGK